jgi:hypothetical protein
MHPLKALVLADIGAADFNPLGEISNNRILIGYDKTPYKAVQ